MSKHNPRKQNSPRLPDDLEFRQVPGHPSYLVSIDGRFWTTLVDGQPAEKTLSARKYHSNRENTDRSKRLRLRVMCNGRVTMLDAASLACEAWHGPRPDGAIVDFADNDVSNLCRDNLAWRLTSGQISDKEFVLAWQSSYSVAECAERLGCEPSGMYARAKRLREAGVRLKFMTERLSVEDLNSLLD